MVTSNTTNRNLPPVAIGGVGGSGTRLFAQILKKLNFYIGSDINDANDNLWFTLLFKRTEITSVSKQEFEELVRIFVSTMTGDSTLTKSQIKLIDSLALSNRTQHDTKWLKARATSIQSGQHPPTQIKDWGWKEPNTCLVINRLQMFMPDIKYIHVIRNGLDMAHSTNQNQLNFLQ